MMCAEQAVLLGLLQVIKERNHAELERLDLNRQADFRRMMASFAATQAQYVQASADMWATLAKQFSE